MFIKLIDTYGNPHILNKNYIIHVETVDLDEYKTLINFGSGFMNTIYMSETIEEINRKLR